MNEELALKIANDIAENIDCKETRKVLRECITWFADKLAKERNKNISKAYEEMLRKIGKSLL